MREVPAGTSVAGSDDNTKVAALLELEAQLLYRLGGNQDCILLYDQLFQVHKVQTVGWVVTASRWAAAAMEAHARRERVGGKCHAFVAAVGNGVGEYISRAIMS